MQKFVPGREVAERAWSRRALGGGSEDAPGCGRVLASAFPAAELCSGSRVGPGSAAAPDWGPTGNKA